MSDATGLRLLGFGLRILVASVILVGPRFWPWLPGRVPGRGSTFFGVRVPSDFAISAAGRNILRVFHRRLWIGLCTLAAIYVAAVPDVGRVMSLSTIGAVVASQLIGWVLYVLAGRRTRIEAGFVPEPSVRIATLLPEGQPQPLGMAIAAFTAMIVPVAVPLITGILFALNRSRYPARFHPERVPVQIAIAAGFGMLMAGILYALRFRARASDWAPTPEASLNYRTYLGLQMGTASLAPILGLSALSLGPLYGARMGILWFGGMFLGLFALIGLVNRMRSKLVKLLDPQSSDPMPDHCWKWNSYYYNPGDPAWVVPTRSGTSCSLNHAHPFAWAAHALAIAGALVVLLRIR